MSDNMTMIILTVAVLAVLGLVIGIMLVYAGNKFAVEVDQKEIDVRACLPGNNCGACGYAGCDAVAAAIAKGEAPTNICPVGGAGVAQQISEIMGVDAGEEAEKKVAFVRCAGTCDNAKRKSTVIGIRTCEAFMASPGKGEKYCAQGCFGQGDCTRVCQFDTIHIIDGVASVDRTKCVACGMCASVCPQKLIDIIPMKSIYTVQCSNTERFPVLKTQCDVGCRGCGLCVRQCEQGAITLADNLASIDYEKCVGCGKCAEKCPAKIITMHK